jgi:hypothetical protein
MARSRARSFFALILWVLSFAFIEIACGSTPPEQQLLTNFFRAARVRDNTTLGNIAAVNFNPRTEGTVEDFEIVSVSAEQRRPVEIRGLIEEEAKAKEEEAEFSRRSAEFQAANKEAISRVAKAESAQQPVRGADAEVLASITRWRTEQAQYSRKLSDARTRLTRERGQVAGSLTPPGQPDVDVSSMAAELVSKEVTVNAQVRTPEGQTMPRTIVFTFQRAVARDGDRTREGRWLITGLQQKGGASPTS